MRPILHRPVSFGVSLSAFQVWVVQVVHVAWILPGMRLLGVTTVPDTEAAPEPDPGPGMRSG